MARQGNVNMSVRRPLWLIVRLGGFLLALVQTGTVPANDVRFNEHIRPILTEHCFPCHGPDEANREAELRLDEEAAAKLNAIVPNDPDRSELFRRMTSSEPDERMPPPDSGKSLTNGQIELMRQWILQGADYEGHWAFEPVGQPDPPQIGDAATTTIDRFVLAALNDRGLTLSPPVNRLQLIRRATFDLIGLPPTWEEVTSFVSDTSPRAFDRVVDRLLESPRYGERWGRHWLDIARYADTHGGSAIGYKRFPFSYTYRDYVIRAFNDDVPYDRFVTEQLAADQMGLPADDPALAGMGFLTVGMQFRNLHDRIDDQVDVISRGLLGLTVACARCHDHKFDPVPTADYYSLYAILASSRTPELLPLIGEPDDTKPYRDYQQELSRRQAQHQDMAREQNVIMRGRLRMQVGIYLRALAEGTPEQDLSTTFLSYRTDDLRPLVLNRWRDYLAGMSADDPVFGPWVRLRLLKPDDFQTQCAAVVDSLTEENGDPTKLPAMHKLNAAAPRWNPVVLESLTNRKSESLLDVADAYGEMFANVHRRWLQAQIEASLEAIADANILPDEDPGHLNVNSAVSRQLRRHLYREDTPTAMTDEIAATLLNRTVRDNLNGRKDTIHKLQLTSPGSPPRAMTVREDEQPGEFHIFRRGNPIDRGDVVEARFLSALSTKDEEPFPTGKRRLSLAQAIVDTANPLTRRVIVNWVWQHHFGRGLVRTPDDFGTHGDPPTHPMLLDYLAAVLPEHHWSIKTLHRQIMLTAVYQQGAIENAESRALDADNKLLWRMPRRRLEMEAMRDAMLAVSGELQTKMGGRPFELLSDPVVPRRSVYAFVNRDIVSSMASTFDVASPATCTAKRPDTTVPQQTLFALNSAFIQDRAVALASLSQMTSAKNDADRIQLLYQRTFSRSAEPDEIEIAQRFVGAQDGESDTDAWQRLAHVLLAANEFVFVD
jgi:Protein of unknown function (DUF1553)/Protein of unknown function (DUF1549)/Planctomycete cytochrome C